ncbi:MAG: enoyl-CoA hydratase [Acidimicrobiia bacterium]|nr:enoyl-CoA hydratase [Acidimicrobiia bacterium]
MTYERITTDLQDGVLTITLVDVANRNVLSSAMVAELCDAMDKAEADEAVRVVVVTNIGRVFSAGADLTERTSGDDELTGVDLTMVFGRIIRSAKPYVGRIDGHAIAGGLGLAASMDISVTRADAKYGFSEVRLGLAPAMISVICLPKMRRAEAASALLRGNRFDGTEAARLGLVTDAVHPGDLDDRIEAIVADLVLGGPQALAVTKRLLREVPTRDLEDALPWASELSASVFASPEGQEGMAAYLEKRKPNWA